MDAILKDRKEKVQNSRPLEFLLSKWVLHHCAATTDHLFNSLRTSKVRRVEQGSRNPESNFLWHQWRTHFLTWPFSFLFLFCLTFLSSVQNSFYLFFHWFLFAEKFFFSPIFHLFVAFLLFPLKGIVWCVSANFIFAASSSFFSILWHLVWLQFKEWRER